MSKIKRVRAINYWTLGGMEGERPVEEVLEQAKDMGFEGVELCYGAGVFGPKTTEKRARGYRETARKLGVRLDTVASGTFWNLSLGSPKTSERKRAVEFTKKYLQAANWVGAKAALVIPGAVDVAWDPSRPVVPAQEVWKNATKSIRSLVPVAKKARVAIALENVWNKFLTGPFEMKMFIDQFKTGMVGSYFDVANNQINGYPTHWIQVLGRRIKGVHVKNWTGQDCGGTLKGFGEDLLKGDVDIPACLRALDKIGYKGPITAEMIPFCRLPDLNLPDPALARKTAKQLRKVTG